MPLTPNSLTDIRDALVAAMQADAAFTGVAVIAESAGDVASRVAKLKEVALVVAVGEPLLAPGESARVISAEFDIHIYECPEINRRSGSPKTAHGLLIAAFNLFFHPANEFRPVADWTETMFDGHGVEQLEMPMGKQMVPVIHRALAGHLSLFLPS